MKSRADLTLILSTGMAVPIRTSIVRCNARCPIVTAIQPAPPIPLHSTTAAQAVALRRLVLFARHPVPGQVKTRLFPALRLDDLDRPEEVTAWQRLVESEDADLSTVSVIIPALNTAAHIGASIASASAGTPHQILVVDGGSTDDTPAIARAAWAIVLSSKPGRARQMNAGAARATGNVLLFLHADTRLPAGWEAMVQDILGQPGVVAGAFRFRVEEPFAGRWLVECTTNLRSRWLQSPYGDQGQFLRRALFEELGGFANLPIMEDYELIVRLRRRGRLVTAKATAVTSGRRWRRLGVLRTSVINKLMIAGYRLGVRPDRLARLYHRLGSDLKS